MSRDDHGSFLLNCLQVAAPRSGLGVVDGSLELHPWLQCKLGVVAHACDLST